LPNRVEKVALCDFQYSFWMLYLYHYSNNLGMQFHLIGALNKTTFEKALAAVVKQCDTFWLSFNEMR
jgi:hypothetical protein